MDYVHMSGAGNDFAVVDIRRETPELSQLAVSLCRSTGADGLLAVDNSEIADFRLHYYNSDGSRADLCGNGSRCICRFAYDRGIAGEEMTVQTDAGLVYGKRIAEDQYRIRLTDPAQIRLFCKPGVHYALCGVPHALMELPTLSWQDRKALLPLARQLRHDPDFPQGANVTFYRWLAPGRVQVLTFERGVEDYTLACGTGCGALTAVLHQAGQLPGGKLTAENPGGTLTMQIGPEGLFLQGPAVYVADPA